jgi:hypothetical protein
LTVCWKRRYFSLFDSDCPMEGYNGGHGSRGYPLTNFIICEGVASVEQRAEFAGLFSSQ